MPVWVSNLIVTLLTRLTSWLFTKGLEKLHTHNQEIEIDESLRKFKKAYKEAFNGEKVTHEQRRELNKAIADFLRGPSD